MNNWPRIAAISVGVLTVEMGAFAYSSYPSPLYEKLIDKEFVNVTGYSLLSTSYMALLIATETGLNINLLVVLSVFVSFSLAAGVTMLKLALKIAKTLKGSSATSETVTKHQKRIFSLLLYQV